MISVSSYIADRPKSQALIMNRLRNLVLDVGVRVEEKISYGVPFFYFNAP